MDIFKELIKELSPLLKEMGFNKKGNSFYLETGKNNGVINFQKSRDSTKDLTKLTINFGIYSYVLGQQFQYDYKSSAKPEVEQCQWRARVGAFMPDSPDYWWCVNVSDSLSSITSNIIEAVQSIIVPEIEKRLSDEGLMNSWINDSYAGTTEIGRFKYVTTLLKEKEDFGTLNQFVETFMEKSRGRPNENIAMEHLKVIGYSK